MRACGGVRAMAAHAASRLRARALEGAEPPPSSSSGGGRTAACACPTLLMLVARVVTKVRLRTGGCSP